MTWRLVPVSACGEEPLTEAALLNRRMDYFRDRYGIQGETGEDDLGPYELAVLRLAPGGLVGVLDHRWNSRGAVLLVHDVTSLESILHTLLGEFDLTTGDVLWRRGEDWPESSESLS